MFSKTAFFIGFLSLSLVCILSVSKAYAEDGQNSYKDVPEILSRGIVQNMLFETYMDRQLNFIRQNGGEDMVLSKEGYEDKKQNELFQTRLQKLKSFIDYDLNFDGNLTKEEVQQVVEKRFPQYRGAAPNQIKQRRETEYKRIFDADTNQDGIVSYKEMSDPEDGSSQPPYYGRRFRGSEEYKSYLDLDLNGDGKLTLAEMRELAADTFQKLDVNGDKFLDNLEAESVMAWTRMKNREAMEAGRREARRKECNFPPNVGQGSVYYVGVYEGAAMANVTTAGQDHDVFSIDIVIQDDVKDADIFLVSHKPIIWNMSGNVKSVRHVYLYNSSSSGADGRSTSGIVGYKKESTTFLNMKCRLPYKQVNASQPNIFNKSNGGLFEKIPFAGYNYDPGAAVISAKRVEFKPSEPNKTVPEGFDPAEWSQVVGFNPGGLKQYALKDIVSAAPAEEYEVYPNQVGLARLLYEGKIERFTCRNIKADQVLGARYVDMNRKGREPQTTSYFLTNAYKIVKPISRFPAEMGGAHQANFILAKGVPMPEGHFGHGKVFQEEHIKSVWDCYK